MSDAINLIVSAVRQDAVKVVALGQMEPNVVGGRTMVEFTTGDHQTFDIDWTWRGDPLPEVGSKWTLTQNSGGVVPPSHVEHHTHVIHNHAATEGENASAADDPAVQDSGSSETTP